MSDQENSGNHWARLTCLGALCVAAPLLIFQIVIATYNSITFLTQVGFNTQTAMAAGITVLLTVTRGAVVGAGSFFLHRSAQSKPTWWKGTLSIVLAFVALSWTILG